MARAFPESLHFAGGRSCRERGRGAPRDKGGRRPFPRAAAAHSRRRAEGGASCQGCLGILPAQAARARGEHRGDADAARQQAGDAETRRAARGPRRCPCHAHGACRGFRYRGLQPRPLSRHQGAGSVPRRQEAPRQESGARAGEDCRQRQPGALQEIVCMAARTLQRDVGAGLYHSELEGAFGRVELRSGRFRHPRPHPGCRGGVAAEIRRADTRDSGRVCGDGLRRRAPAHPRVQAQARQGRDVPDQLQHVHAAGQERARDSSRAQAAAVDHIRPYNEDVRHQRPLGARAARA